MSHKLGSAFGALFETLVRVEATTDQGHARSLEFALFDNAVGVATLARAEGKQALFIGNGGSAGIASHMAADFFKAGGFNARCFNDPALLTCLSNDVGYDSVFSIPLARVAKAGDVLFAISSSGKSDNILKAVGVAREKGANVITLSGFEPSNPLRKLGVLNFYVPSRRYGTVEVAHHAILHAILDRITEK